MIGRKNSFPNMCICMCVCVATRWLMAVARRQQQPFAGSMNALPSKQLIHRVVVVENRTRASGICVLPRGTVV